MATGSVYGQTSIDSVMEARADDEQIMASIEGALLYLADRQIKDLPGKQSALIDASELGDGCRGQVFLNLPGLPTIPFRAGQKEKPVNQPGAWAGMVHLLPNRIGFKGISVLSKSDFNHFIPLSIVYPLFLFDESQHPIGDRLAARMLKNAWNVSLAYQRGVAYNFWLPLKQQPEFSGPSTFNLNFANRYRHQVDKGYTDFVRNMVMGRGNLPDGEWMTSMAKEVENQNWTLATFNIPNDADDTALALAFQSVRQQLKEQYPDDGFFDLPDNFVYNHEALNVITEWRDLNRLDRYEDGRDSWKGKNSGAFLTWLKDEELATFEDLTTGVIPLGKNNVDGVVNANVLFAMSLSQASDTPGYRESIRLIEHAINNQTWPECGLYYPQMMMFPYTASRAFRDGNIEELQPAMGVLLQQLLDMQAVYGKLNPNHKGAFPGGEDHTDQLSTALALCALMNISLDVAQKNKLEYRYRMAINRGIQYLINKRTKTKLLNPTHLGINPSQSKKAVGFHWQEGIYFSSSYRDLAHWRSEAFSTAMVLEALSKYLLAWDYGNAIISQGRKLELNNLVKLN